MENRRRKAIVVLVTLTIICILLFIRFIWHRIQYAVTDAVFVKADRMIYLSFPKVNGRIKRLFKNEGDPTKKGEIIAELDCQDYHTKVVSLENTIKANISQKESLSVRADWLSKDINYRHEAAIRKKKQLEAELESVKSQRLALSSQIKLTKNDVERYKSLFKENLISKRDLEAIETQLEVLKNQEASLISKENSIKEQISQVNREIERIINEKKQVLELYKNIESVDKQTNALRAQLEEAKLYRDYCKLIAPEAGYIAKKFHSEGDVINPGEPIYALVDTSSIYVLVLLEETKLKGIRKGCKAYIKLDAYPREKFEGEVMEILPATAAEFALVPRDISAGEFTKLAQRVPVKIRITKGKTELLRVGLGGEVEIKRER
ncbi:MAG: HlyD family secretion protein [candidate division WOR-3 bacterium]